jgi:RNA polymerase sigma-70 factor, ECF subfamily
VADRFVGRVVDSPYFGNDSRLEVSWRMAVGEVDGEPVVIVMRRATDGWNPSSIVGLDLTAGQIVGIRD